MASAFDPYREALVVETQTLWSPDARAATDGWSRDRRQRFARRLHSDAGAAANLEYVRVHTGFCRRLTVETADLERIGPPASGDASATSN